MATHHYGDSNTRKNKQKNKGANDASEALDNPHLIWSKTKLIVDGNTTSLKGVEDKPHPTETGNEDCFPKMTVEAIASADGDLLDTR
jgi:hypothetical protein